MAPLARASRWLCALQHTACAACDAALCTIDEHPSVAAGMAAQRHTGVHSPFIVRFPTAHVAVTGQPQWQNEPTARTFLLGKYGDQPDHYGGDGQGSVREHWEAPAETRPALVGIHLDDEDRQAWRHVFEGTTSGTGVWSDVGGGLGAILGRRGSGVANDAHMPVFFHHLFGRKVWGFSRDEVEEWQGRQGVCEPELLAMPRACVLSAGDFLYAPSGWYHSTCHLDATSLTLIQWAEEEQEQAQRRPAGSSAAADRGLEARVDLLSGLRALLALVIAEALQAQLRACLAAMLMAV